MNNSLNGKGPAKADKIEMVLAELAAMDRPALVKHWITEIHSPPPKSASRVFLLRALSYECQARRAPALFKADHKALQDILSEPVQADSPTPTKPRTMLVPGSRLVREWNGRTYTVSVIEEGFVYQDKVWPSLSAIARDITGAHWSGPRFFGLHSARSS